MLIKKNLLDIFFNENHGLWILLGFIPFAVITSLGIYATLLTPVLLIPTFPFVGQVVGTIILVILTVVVFYWLRYGGTLNHRNKPEWDFVPAIIKK